ncbi:MAG: hypothetical protein O6947_04235, partial [Acidobacteria bacterium]|nr:hypothetical protein [Acidobacteriota bacterium]
LEVTGFFPEDPDARYNLAGVYALMNRPDDAIRELRIDFELGDIDYDYLLDDPWFEVLHGDQHFGRLIEKMKKAAADHVD